MALLSILLPNGMLSLLTKSNILSAVWRVRSAQRFVEWSMVVSDDFLMSISSFAMLMLSSRNYACDIISSPDPLEYQYVGRHTTSCLSET